MQATITLAYEGNCSRNYLNPLIITPFGADRLVVVASFNYSQSSLSSVNISLLGVSRENIFGRTYVPLI